VIDWAAVGRYWHDWSINLTGQRATCRDELAWLAAPGNHRQDQLV